ncbi:MAG: beta-1,6-N-acetylglucosaminyltransferase [Coriobacteriia bacterium]|nr:beta-1,6-N-acetylglucosaminyltransferase [Coriobacteriia bacterium]
MQQAKHAYLIIAHRPVEELAPLFSALDDARNDLFLHIDPRAGSFVEQDFAPCVKHSKLTLVKPEKVVWGDYSLVRAEMRLFQAAAEAQDAPYAYYHVLSGQDLPLKSADEIHAFFSAKQGKEFIHFTTPEDNRQKEERVRCYYPFQHRAGRTMNIWRRSQNLLLALQRYRGLDRFRKEDIQLQSGAQWLSLTDDCVHFILGQRSWVHTHCRWAFVPDEFFVQTLVYNSPFRERLYRNQLDDDHAAAARRIDWERGNPYTWRMSDYEELASCSEMFARKFDPAVDADIITALVEHVRSSNVPGIMPDSEAQSGS